VREGANILGFFFFWVEVRNGNCAVMCGDGKLVVIFVLFSEDCGTRMMEELMVDGAHRLVTDSWENFSF
jgi:hypothetical protein